MDYEDYKSVILYYGRERYYHTMQTRALEALTKFPGDPIFRFYNGIALVLGNRQQEGIRELYPVQNEKEIAMAVILGLIYAHKRCTVLDREALAQLDEKLKQERLRLTGNGAYFCAIFLLLSGKFEKAKEYAEKSLKMNNNSTEAMVLKGWAELNVNQRVTKSTYELFDRANRTGKNLDGNLGQMQFHRMNNDFEAAIEVLNKLSIHYSGINIPLIEKMKTQLASRHWDHAVESSHRILSIEPNNIEALCLQTIVHFCRNGNCTDGLVTLNKLFSCVERIEPSNGDLYLHLSQLFSRVCGRNEDVLSATLKFVEKASQMSPRNTAFIIEVGYQNCMLGRYKEANKNFKSATRIDDSSILALCGLTLCELSEAGPTEQARQQIEFLIEICSGSKIPLLLFMSSKLHNSNSDKAMALLIECCEIQFRDLKISQFGSDYLKNFNPDFLLQVIREMLKYSPVEMNLQLEQTMTRENLHISLKHSLNVLDEVIKACPGLLEALYLMAKVEFLSGDLNSAVTTLNRILQDIDYTYTDGHLLLAQIHIQEGQYKKAAQDLELCLSHNFKVRDYPMYYLLNGIILKKQNQFDEASKNFATALDLTRIQTIVNSPTKSHRHSTGKNLTITDRVTLYLEMVENYNLMNQIQAASKIMQTAIEEFANTSEEGRVLIAHAELILKKSNVVKAIEVLKGIQPGQHYYLQAKRKLANIYLYQKKDRLAFINCFKELVEHCPGAESCLMLGNAYMSIQEPELAIEGYKMALQQNPRDPLLASKLGRAYVKTHQYTKAISYYKDTVMDPINSGLNLDLAELYLKLKQYSNAEQTLIESSKRVSDDLGVLQTKTKQLLLLARIREKSGHLNSSINTLKEAFDNQLRVQQRVTVENFGAADDQLKILSKICILLAEQSMGVRDNDQAIKYYKDALKYMPSDIKTLVALGKLYMQLNNMDQCQHTCAQILQIDSNNEAASVMMADISFRRMEFVDAAYHFSQLLILQPTYWTALARLIEIMRRSATLDEIEPFIQRAELSSGNLSQDPGFNFCNGLYQWYLGNPNMALKFFNVARRDEEWGQQAIRYMIEICINPDSELPNDSMLEVADDIDFHDSRSMAIKTASRLLHELKPRPGGMDNETLTLRLHKNFILLASGQRTNVENALSDFSAIAAQDQYKDHVGPILGMSTSHILLKQQQRAKNQLKRVVKQAWTYEEAEYLERCWLILADLYIQANKLDMANELLQRILEYNKSCVKCFELLGYIAEKDQSYKVAANQYASAWKFGGRTKPTIGYKLAFNYMKVKKYAEAIDVCHHILKLYPDYPSIRKDILEKCRNNLRS